MNHNCRYRSCSYRTERLDWSACCVDRWIVVTLTLGETYFLRCALFRKWHGLCDSIDFLREFRRHASVLKLEGSPLSFASFAGYCDGWKCGKDPEAWYQSLGTETEVHLRPWPSSASLLAWWSFSPWFARRRRIFLTWPYATDRIYRPQKPLLYKSTLARRRYSRSVIIMLYPVKNPASMWCFIPLGIRCIRSLAAHAQLMEKAEDRVQIY